MIEHYYLFGTDAEGNPIVPEPVYKTSAEYREFRERYEARVPPQLEEHRVARARSEHEARGRWIGNSGGRWL